MVELVTSLTYPGKIRFFCSGVDLYTHADTAKLESDTQRGFPARLKGTVAARSARELAEVLEATRTTR